LIQKERKKSRRSNGEALNEVNASMHKAHAHLAGASALAHKESSFTKLLEFP
jgi:hypothetical protein